MAFTTLVDSHTELSAEQSPHCSQVGLAAPPQCIIPLPDGYVKEISLPGRGSPYLTSHISSSTTQFTLARNHHGRTTDPKRKMLPFAEKRRSFSRRGPWSYRPFEVVHHTPMICNMQDSFLWNRMTSYGHRRPLYTTWSSEHWQLKGVVDAQESGQFKLCHIIRGEYIKGITRGCNINN